MKKKSNIFILFSFLNALLLLSGCECVTNIDTPRVITPSQYAHVLFLNSIPETDLVKVWSEFWRDNLKINYEPDLEQTQYQDIEPGTNNIKLLSKKDSILFNGIIDLNQKHYYTFIGYGFESRVQALLLNDSINNYLKTNTYFRCIHVSADAPHVIFKIYNQFPIYFSLPFRAFTKFTAVIPSQYNIEVKDAMTDSTLLVMKNVVFEQGKIYNIILRGYYETLGNNEFSLQVISSDVYLKKKDEVQ